MEIESSSHFSPSEAYDQLFRLERDLLAATTAKGPFDPAVRRLRTSIRDGYEALILDHPAFNDVFDVEQSLWRLHYREIEGFRLRIRKLSTASKVNVGMEKQEGEANNTRKRKKGNNKEEPLLRALISFKSFLAEATGFFHALYIKIRLQSGVTSERFLSENNPSDEFRRCMATCHRILIYLGDLARYKEVYGIMDITTRDWRVAAAYYKQATVIWPCSGNPYHQLAVLCTYCGNCMSALYLYCRSLAARAPFQTAWDNLDMLFEKNKQLLQQAHPPQKCGEKEGSRTMFIMCFIDLVCVLLRRPSTDEIDVAFDAAEREFEHIFHGEFYSDNRATSSDKLACNVPLVLQVITVLIFCMHQIGGKPEMLNQSHLLTRTLIFSIKFSSMLTMVVEEAESAFPVAVILVEWFANQPDSLLVIQRDKIAASSFSEFCEGMISLDASLLNKFTMDAELRDNDLFRGFDEAQMEDHELYGFIPLDSIHVNLDFKIQPVRYGIHDLVTFSSWKKRYTEALEMACKISKSHDINEHKATTEDSTGGIKLTLSLKEWIDKTFFSTTDLRREPVVNEAIQHQENIVNLDVKTVSTDICAPETTTVRCISHPEVNAQQLISETSVRVNSDEQALEENKENLYDMTRMRENALNCARADGLQNFRMVKLSTNGHQNNLPLVCLDRVTHVMPSSFMDSIVDTRLRHSLNNAFRKNTRLLRNDGLLTYETKNPFVLRLESLSE